LSHDQHAYNLDPTGRALVERVLTLTTPSSAQRLGHRSIGPGSVGMARASTHRTAASG
jgi:hypothetical protein